MTPSSPSEPEPGTKPATTGSDTGAADGTSAGSTPEVTQPAAPAEPSAESPASTPEPVEPVAPTVPVATDAPKTEPVEPVGAEPTPSEPATTPVATSEPIDSTRPGTGFTAPSEPVTAAPAATTGDKDDDGDDDGNDDDDDLEVLTSGHPDRYPTLIPLVGALAGLTVIAVLILVALALPAVKSEPRHLPIGVAGTPDVTKQLKTILSPKDGDKKAEFDIDEFSTEADLRTAIEERKIYGGLSISNAGPAMLVSSAASVRVADELSGVASSLSQQAQTQIPVNDVVALPKKDSHGEGLVAAGLPIVVGSVLPALLLLQLYRRRVAAQIGLAAGASVLIGLGLAAVLDLVLGTTDGSNFLLVSSGLAGFVLATSLLLIGLNAVAGRWAAWIGALVLVLIAEPLSGLSSAPEWLPSPWGAIGQFLPPGANATLLRSDAFFDGKGALESVLVLAIWGLVGLFLVGIGYLLSSGSDTTPDAEEEIPAESYEPVGV